MTSRKDDENTQNPERRTALKTLLTGGGIVTLSALPGQWVKPVVDAVVLPSHAQTSPPSRAANGFSVSSVGSAPGWLDGIIPTAHAGAGVLPPGFLCIEESGGGIVASYETDGDILTGGGPFGNCVTLSCGRFDVSLIVSGANGDGSFDFELYGGGSCAGSPAIGATTNVPCNVGSKKCIKEKEGEKEFEFITF